MNLDMCMSHVTLTTIKMINASIASRCFLCLSAGLGPFKTRGQLFANPQLLPFFCSCLLPCDFAPFLPTSRIYFLTLWIWSDLMHYFSQQRVTGVRLHQFLAYISQVLNTAILSCGTCQLPCASSQALWAWDVLPPHTPALVGPALVLCQTLSWWMM